MKNLIPLCLAAALVFLASGCSSSGTDTADTASTTNTTTTGQELIDLEKAHSSEIITQEEYDKKKEEILNR